jgi:type I restriction enzyme S subunit
MIDGLRPYAEMRSSGVDWLPALPNGWEIHRAKYSFREADERSESGGEELLSVSHKTGVTPRSQKNITMFMAESYEGHKVCRPGDIVVNTMWAWMAAIGVSRHIGIVSPAYGIYRPRTAERFEPKFLDYLLRIEAYRAEYLRSSRGVTTSRLRLYPPDFLNIPFVQPPLDDQRLIVQFLDWHGAQTAKLIRAKKRIIALLNEQKQAIIHRAVTRGLDQNAKLKPSGIPWLGDVPEGWEVKKLKYLVRFNNGLAFKPSDWSNSGAPIIRIQNLNGSEIFNYTTKVDLPEELLIKKGDILFSWSGNVGTSFGPFVWNRDFSGYLNQHIFKVEKIGSNRRYFYYVLKAVTKHVEENTHGIIGLVHITKPELGSISVPVAPFEEQVAIAGWLDNRLVGVNAVIDRAQREIALIQEFRTRLIADVVTGKLDVRAAAATLPDVTDIEPVDDLAEVDDLDEAIDATENEEVAA